MAERPVFIPRREGALFVDTVMVAFRWHAGMAPSQKKKNVIELHQSAEAQGLHPLLEISSKSDREAGKRLSAFHQKIRISGSDVTVECAYQGSKVFENGGPYTDLFMASSRDAKRDERLRNSGKLIGFAIEGAGYPLSPPTAFYDWLYVNALFTHRGWLRRLDQVMGFTDIEFNPERSLNCQAHSCALFVALEQRGLLDEALQSFSAFLAVTEASAL